MFSNKERVVIEIDPDTSTYKMDISYCKLSRLEAVLEDVLKSIRDKTILDEPHLEVTENNN